MASTGIIYTLIARDAASRTFDRVGRSASATDGTLARLGRTAKIAGEAMAAGLAVGLAESVKQAVEFQSSMAKIQTQAGGTAKDVKVLSDQVLKLGTTTQQGPQQLSEALYHLKSVGMDNVDAMKALKTASDLAAVGGSDLESTTNALAGAWRTGIKGATSFGEAAATVNSIIGAGNMTMKDFTDALASGILPTAKTFGLSLKQVGAALALFTDEGVPASDAATRLRMSISLLGAPSGAAEKQLKKIHLTGLQLAQAMRSKDGLIGAIQLLKDHLDKSGMSAAQQSQILSRAFGGGKSSSGILSMISNLDVLKKKQDQVNSSTGKYADAVKAQRKTAEAQWKILVSNLEVMGIRVGTKVLPPLTSFVHFLASTAMPAAARFGTAMANVIPVATIRKGIADAKGLVSDFLGGLQGQKAPDLPTPMLKAPVAPKALALPKAPKSDAMKLGESIRKAVTGGIASVDWSKVGKTLGGALGTAFQWVAKNGGQLVQQLITALSKIDWFDVGKTVGGQAVGFALGFISGLGKDIFSLTFWKKHWLEAIIAIVSIIPIGRLAGALGKLLERIPILKVVAPLLKGVGKLGGWVESGLSKSVLKPLGKFGKSVLDGIVSGFVKVLPGAEGKLDKFLGDLAVGILGYAGRFAGAGERLIGGLGRGILSFGGKIGEWIGKVIGWLTKPFAKAGGWLWSKGSALVGGLKDGIISVAKTIGGWTWDHIISPVVNSFAKAGSWLWSKGSSLVSGFKDGIVSVAKTIGGWTWDHIIHPVTGSFAKAGSWLWDKGGALISGLKSGILDGMSKIGGWVKSNIVDPVVDSVKHFFGIRSPSRVFMSIGGHLIAGLMKGMSQTSGTAIAHKVFGSMPSALAAIVKKGLVSVSSLPGQALKALGGLGGDILGLLGLGGSGGGSSANQKIGEALAAARGWSGPQWAALKNLWNGESGWNERALNKSSGAYGIPQSLPASKMASAGSDWQTNPATQIKWGLSYIASVYGNPLNAYSQWLARSPHWYAKGTGGAAPGLAWVGERGPELVAFKGGEDVLSHPQSMAFAKANGIQLPGYASGTISNAGDRVHRDRQRVEDARNAVANARRRRKGVAAAEKRLAAAEKELQAAEISLKNAQRNAKTSISNTIATGLQKTLSTGTASAIASAIKSLATKLLNAGFNWTAGFAQRRGSQLESLANRRDAIAKTIAAANQYASDQAGNIKDFLSISGTSATDIGSLISQMTSQQKTASNFVALSGRLKVKGASKALLQALSDAGPGSQLATVLGSATTGDVAKLNKLLASGGSLATSFGKSMADLMYDSGKHAGDGFLAGLKAQQKDLEKQMSKLASDLVKAIKKALKIKSPSQVFRDEVGKNVVLGMAHGINMHGHLVGSAAQRLADTATGVSVRRRYVPTAASGRTSTGQEGMWERLAAALEAAGSEVHVHFNDDRLRDLIDVQVKPKIKASEDRQAYRAKVGRRNG